jgi:hypothetical protein
LGPHVVAQRLAGICQRCCAHGPQTLQTLAEGMACVCVCVQTGCHSLTTIDARQRSLPMAICQGCAWRSIWQGFANYVPSPNVSSRLDRAHDLVAACVKRIGRVPKDGQVFTHCCLLLHMRVARIIGAVLPRIPFMFPREFSVCHERPRVEQGLPMACQTFTPAKSCQVDHSELPRDFYRFPLAHGP